MNDKETTRHTTSHPAAHESEQGGMNEPATRAAEIAEQSKQDAGEIATKAKEKAQEVTDEVKRQASGALDDAKEQARGTVREQKDQTTERLHSVAGALRESGRQLHDRDEDMAGDFVDMAASRVDQFAGYLERRDMDDLWNGVRSFAQRQPELFVVGSLAAGFFLGRFLKSTQENDYGRYDRYESRDSRPTRASQGYSTRREYGGYVPAGGYEEDDEPHALRTRDTMPTDEYAFAEGATAYNTERAQRGRQGATTVRGRDTDWGVDYGRPELSGTQHPPQSSEPDWESAQDTTTDHVAPNRVVVNEDESQSTKSQSTQKQREEREDKKQKGGTHGTANG